MYRLTHDDGVIVRANPDGSQTFIPKVDDNTDYRNYLQWIGAGNSPEAAPPIDVQSAVVNAVQARLDQFARTRSYDSILSACTYVTSAVLKFAAEGQYCVGARDAHWAKCYEVMGAVMAGQRPMPTVEEVVAEMPSLQWPE